MFSPLKIWRRWHRKVNQNQKRHAVASAVAATAVAPLVLARGHRIEKVSEIPLVIDSLSVEKTSQLLKTLIGLGAEAELRRCAESKKLRAGKGKYRNRRYVIRKGPLIVYNDDENDQKVVKAARNIVGLDVCNVHRLNLLKLAPGGTLGRFVIWTQSAFKALNDVFGTYRRDSSEKSGYNLQRNVVQTADVSRLINSDAVQNIIRAPSSNPKLFTRKRNPLRNKGVLNTLNPFASKKAQLEQKLQTEAHNKKKTAIKNRRKSKEGKTRHATSLQKAREFWSTQVDSQNTATKKWYDDIAASELKEEYTGGAITGGADEEEEAPVVVKEEKKDDKKAAPAAAAGKEEAKKPADAKKK